MTGQVRATPGPWFIFGNGHCVGGPAIAPFGESQTAGIAMCGMAKRHPDECEANARLICAAPDLLAMLQFARSILERDGIRPLIGEAFTQTDLEKIDAAIAKAVKP